jgi:hypothetical protein
MMMIPLAAASTLAPLSCYIDYSIVKLLTTVATISLELQVLINGVNEYGPIEDHIIILILMRSAALPNA